MSIAYVLINVELSQDKKVHKQLLGFDEVKEAQMLYGVYDIIVKIEDKDLNNLKNIISNKLRNVSGILSTMTTIIAEI